MDHDDIYSIFVYLDKNIQIFLLLIPLLIKYFALSFLIIEAFRLARDGKVRKRVVPILQKLCLLGLGIALEYLTLWFQSNNSLI